MIQTVRGFPRVLTLDGFKNLFTDVPKGPDLGGLIMGYKQLQKARWGNGHF